MAVGRLEQCEGPSWVGGATETPRPVFGGSLLQWLPWGNVPAWLVAVIKLN